MLTKASLIDPWLQTLRLLSVFPGNEALSSARRDANTLGIGRKKAHLPVFGQPFDVQIYVIERPTKSTATLVWRDSTRCSYGDQVWHVSRARKAGVCAMSGRRIQLGDAIYKPRLRRPAPLNAQAMILGCMINDAELV